MLVLTRKKGERIVINNEIEITILQLDGKRCRVGIKAPDGDEILRGELVDEDEPA